MVADFALMIIPMLVCVLLVAIYVYFGHHILKRGVIFVDIAIAQISVLGLTCAFYLGYELESNVAYFYALIFSFAGAALFAFSRTDEKRIPQEAIIGICYVVATGMSILFVELAKDPHGGEEIKHLLVGHITLALWGDVYRLALVIVPVGLIHILYFRRFYLSTFEPEKARKEGIRPALWDFLFYLLFGVVVTSSVKVCGVLLVFSFLVIPATCARLFIEDLKWSLIVGWIIGIGVSFFGLLFSWSLSSGPMIVTFFGVLLAFLGVIKYLVMAKNPLRAFGGLVVSLGIFSLLLLSVPLISKLFPPPEHHHIHGPHTVKKPALSKEEAFYQKILSALKEPEALSEQEKILAFCKKWNQKKLLKKSQTLFQRASQAKEETLKINTARLLLYLGQKKAVGLLLEVMKNSQGIVLRDDAFQVLKAYSKKDFGYQSFDDGELNKSALAKWNHWLKSQ